MAAEKTRDRIARLLADLDRASDDRELTERFHRAIEELAPDAEALTAFLTEAEASGRVDRVNAASDRYVAGLAAAIEEDHKRRREAIIPNAFDAFRGEVPAPGDPLSAAENEMTEHEFALFRELHEELSRRLGPPGEEPMTETQVRAAFDQWLTEKPEALELVERLAVFQQFRAASKQGDQ